MSLPRSSTTSFSNFLASENVRKYSVLILILGLSFFVFWLAHYAWIIISNPYPEEYREGAILLMTDFLMHGNNPFTLANHPLMTNNYGFLYNLVVLPFALLFGNTLAVHRVVAIFFILASCTLIIWVLVKSEIVVPFAIAGGMLVMASLMFGTMPLARPDSLGEFFFLLAILFPWVRKFDSLSLLISGAASILAFLAKPYFLMSVGVVAAYSFLFASKKKGLLYGTGTLAVLILTLLFINVFLKCYFLDVILSNAGNSILNTSHMLEQSTRFIGIFLPSFLMFIIVVFAKRGNDPFPAIKKNLAKQAWLNIFHLDQPLLKLSMNYFWFFFWCPTAVVVFWLGKHVGGYMSYYFQLITPALVLGVFQYKDIFRKHAVVTVPLILINISIICFVALYPNKLSPSQEQAWKKLYEYLGNSNQVLNSPVLVPEMIRLGLVPVDSGQSEYFFSIRPYRPNPFAPDYAAVRLQGMNYLRLIRTQILHQRFDHVMVTFDPGYSPFAGRAVIDTYYDPVELLHLAMPQTNQVWTIEISEPAK